MNITAKKESFGARLLKNMRKNWILYLMITPVLLYYIIFSYVPMYGVLLAFKDYKIKLGILGSPWVGFEHFQRFFSAYNFKRLLMNTVGLSVYGMIAGFPIPIIFALMLNYLRHHKLKKAVQMVSYAPYFISTVVICGMISIFMSQDSGIFNVIRGFFGMEPVDFLAKPEWFKHIYVWSGIWQGMGWSSIIYISALAGVDYEMHEAAIVDGAGPVRRFFSITLPMLTPIIFFNLINQVIGAFQAFNSSYLITGGKPLNTTLYYGVHLYNKAFKQFEMGYGSAMAWFMLLIIDFFTALIFRSSSAWVYYESEGR